jgi:hypothetical protein
VNGSSLPEESPALRRIHSVVEGFLACLAQPNKSPHKQYPDCQIQAMQACSQHNEIFGNRIYDCLKAIHGYPPTKRKK